MSIRPGRSLLPFCAVAALSMLLVDRSACPQPAPASPRLGLQEQGTPPMEQPAEPAPERPGLIYEMGRLFHRILPSQGSQGEAGGDPQAEAKDKTGDAGRDAVKG